MPNLKSQMIEYLLQVATALSVLMAAISFVGGLWALAAALITLNLWILFGVPVGVAMGVAWAKLAEHCWRLAKY